MTETEYKQQLDALKEQLDRLDSDFKFMKINNENQYEEKIQTINHQKEIMEEQYLSYKTSIYRAINLMDDLHNKYDDTVLNDDKEIDNYYKQNSNNINKKYQDRLKKFENRINEFEQEIKGVKNEFDNTNEEIQVEYKLKLDQLESLIEKLENDFYSSNKDN